MKNNKNKNLKVYEIQKKASTKPFAPKILLNGIRRKERRDDIYLLYKMNHVIKERNLLQPNQRILIAVSGGQDSICLLRILAQLQKKWNWKLGIIHCDHRWDNRSKCQAEHVAFLALNLQIDYHQGITIESVPKEGIARIWRYDTIQTVAVANNYTAVITGHTASDRIETLLYNLARGSGLHGLQSIRWKRFLVSYRFSHSTISRIKYSFLLQKLKYRKTFAFLSLFQKKKQLLLIRPLLEITRTEIRNVLNIWNLPSWPDVSNKELLLSRNRIRHRLVPYIRRHYNPNIDQTLARWAEIVQSETLFLEHLTNSILLKIEIKKNFSSFADPIEHNFHFSQSAIPVDLFRSLPLAIQRRVLKQYIYKNTGRILGFQYLEQIRLSCLFHTFLGTNGGDKLCWRQEGSESKKKKIKTPWILLPGGIKLFVRKNYIFIFSPLPRIVSKKDRMY